MLLFAKLLLGRDGARDPQILIPIAGIIAWAVIHYVATVPSNQTWAASVLRTPLHNQLRAQGFIALLSLFFANVLWMPVDLSTWQRIASVDGDGPELLSSLRRGTARVLFESPASWCLGVILGLIISCTGILGNGDVYTATAAFGGALAKGSLASRLLGAWAFPVFAAGCVAVMLSTVTSLISAIGFTAFRDLPLPRNIPPSLNTARVWTAVIAILGLTAYPLLRWKLNATLPTLLYVSYSAQLSLFVVVLLALLRRNLHPGAAMSSLVCGLIGCGVSLALAIRLTDRPEFAVLPPLFALVGAAAGYVLAYRPSQARDDA
jgi:hypothetical protein